VETSRVQGKLASGQPAFGLCVMWPSAGVIEAIGAAWDFVWIDGQHGQHDYRSLAECVRACEMAGTSALIRVPGHAYEAIGPALDLAPAGIIVPMVNSSEQAKAVAQCARFAPLGQRSFGGRRIIDLHGRDYVHDANRCQLLIAQIETPQAVDHAEAIAAVDGIDLLFYGPDDMRVARALPMDTPMSEGPLAAAGKRIVAAAAGAGKAAMVPAGNAEALRWALDVGFAACVCASDVGLIKDGSAEAQRLAAAAARR